MQNSLNEIFANFKSRTFSLDVIFTLLESTHSWDHAQSLLLEDCLSGCEVVLV